MKSHRRLGSELCDVQLFFSVQEKFGEKPVIPSPNFLPPHPMPMRWLSVVLASRQDQGVTTVFTVNRLLQLSYGDRMTTYIPKSFLRRNYIRDTVTSVTRSKEPERGANGHIS